MVSPLLLVLRCFTLVFLYLIGTGQTDLPCRARDVGIEGRSTVCVCDAGYCDTITREDPAPGTYVAYTSSNAGKRFEKSYGTIQMNRRRNIEDKQIYPDFDWHAMDSKNAMDADIEENFKKEFGFNGDTAVSIELELDINRQYQFIEGFGGSVTDAAGVNWRKLSSATQTHFINSYFSREGLEYNIIRTPIGGADFSTHPYTYNEEPWYDAALSNFSLSDEDYFYKLPMIKRAQFVATDEIHVVASTWSPPVWMKTNEQITGFAQLKPEYYQSYADYHMRFMEEYDKADVKIWAITTTNEPLNGIIPLVNFNSLGWTPTALGHWVANNLGPTIRNSRFRDTLILAVDDQRYIIPIWLYGMVQANPASMNYIDGIAIHYYGNFIPPSILSEVQSRFPDKILLSTEACEGPMPWHSEKVSIGSWRRARRYVTHILEDLNNYVTGWIDWNLCLDPTGGPNWADNFVDAPILVYDNDEFIKQPMFYAMGHFSKFIPRGSRRIHVTRNSLLTLENVAVLKRNGNYVVLLQNRWSWNFNVSFYISNNRYIEVTMEAQSIKTLEINPN